MIPRVYYAGIYENTDDQAIKAASMRLLETVLESERIELGKRVPIKAHFGEEGNATYLKPWHYDGIIDFLEEKGIETCFMETCVLYGGQRFKRELHQKTAERHGFTRIPVVFADGEHGEDFSEVKIDKRHFKSFKVGKAFLDHDRIIVVSHFKGHGLAGFGGAMKQLGMGFAAKGGKLAMHMGEKPRIKARACKRCEACKKRCHEDALVIDEKPRSDRSRCGGCGACVSACPHGAISIISLASVLKFLGIGNPFIEKLMEGAYAAQLGKRNVYINFAKDITAGCDCEPKRMKPLIGDVGVFASTDPVAIDKACYDMVKARGKAFRGYRSFEYARRIGLGSSEYELVEAR